MLILEAVDGDSHHAVTVYGHWIFDAANERALPLCMEALNKCATPGFKRVLFAIRFTHSYYMLHLLNEKIRPLLGRAQDKVLIRNPNIW